MLHVLATPTLSRIIKAVVDNILYSSELINIGFDTDGLRLRSVDSLGISSCECVLEASRFDKYVISEPITISCCNRSVFSFLKPLREEVLFFVSSSVDSESSESSESEDCELYMCFEPSHTLRLEQKLEDTSPYVDFNIAFIEQDPSWYHATVAPNEFHALLLDLSLWQGYMEVVFSNHQLSLRSSDGVMGQMVVEIRDTKDADQFEIHRKNLPPFQNVYLTKFLKQTCGLAAIRMDIYAKKDCPMIFTLVLDDNISKLIVGVAPVVARDSS